MSDVLSTHFLPGQPYGISEFWDVVRKDLTAYQWTKLTKVTHYKKRGGVQHEFLLASIATGDYFLFEHKLCIERSRVARMVSTSVSSVCPARDTITIFDTGDDEKTHNNVSYIIADIIFADHPTLRELCLVLNHVTHSKQDYQLWNAQCYWFCLATIQLMVEELEGREVPGEDYDKAGKYGDLQVLTRERVKGEQMKGRSQLNAAVVIAVGKMGKEQMNDMTEVEEKDFEEDRKRAARRKADTKTREEAKNKVAALQNTLIKRHTLNENADANKLWAAIERVNRAEEERRAMEVEEQTRWLEPKATADLADGWNDRRRYAQPDWKLRNLWIDREEND